MKKTVLSRRLNRKLQVSITIIYGFCRVSHCKNEDKHPGKALQARPGRFSPRGSNQNAMEWLKTNRVKDMHAVMGVVYAKQLSQIRESSPRARRDTKFWKSKQKTRLMKDGFGFS